MIIAPDAGPTQHMLQPISSNSKDYLVISVQTMNSFMSNQYPISNTSLAKINIRKSDGKLANIGFEFLIR